LKKARLIEPAVREGYDGHPYLARGGAPLPFDVGLTTRAFGEHGGAAMVTGISEAKLVGPNQIDVRLIDGTTVTGSLAMSLRDFLHFGHFLLAVRDAMNLGSLPKRMIDRGRMRESWEPRRDVLERKLCDLYEHE
jgi:hypothetical protein